MMLPEKLKISKETLLILTIEFLDFKAILLLIKLNVMLSKNNLMI